MSVRICIHRITRVIVNDLWTGGVVAIFGGVADGVAHIGETAGVEEIDDQLQLMQALEISDFWLIPGVDQRVEGRLDERRDTATENDLLTEEIGFGFFLEGRFDDASFGRPEPLRIGETRFAGMTSGVLVNCDQCRDANTFLVELAHAMTRALRRDHHHVDALAGSNLTEIDVEAVSEHQRFAWCEMLGDLVVIDRLLGLVRDDDHDDVSRCRCIGDVHDLEPVGFRLRPTLAILRAGQQ